MFLYIYTSIYKSLWSLNVRPPYPQLCKAAHLLAFVFVEEVFFMHLQQKHIDTRVYCFVLQPCHRSVLTVSFS